MGTVLGVAGESSCVDVVPLSVTVDFDPSLALM